MEPNSRNIINFVHKLVDIDGIIRYETPTKNEILNWINIDNLMFRSQRYYGYSLMFEYTNEIIVFINIGKRKYFLIRSNPVQLEQCSSNKLIEDEILTNPVTKFHLFLIKPHTAKELKKQFNSKFNV